MKLTTKTMLVILAFLTLTAASTITISTYFSYKNLSLFTKTYSEVAYKKAKDETKSQVDIALSIAHAVYKRKQALNASEEETKKAIKTILRKMSFYDGSGYIFVYNQKGDRLVLRPAAQSEGKNYYDLKDRKGTQLVKELIDAANKGGGYVTYYFPKASGGEPVPKLSYGALFEPYGWMVGTGQYIDNIDEEVEKINTEAKDVIHDNISTFVIITSVCAVIGSIVIFYLIKIILSNPLMNLTRKTKIYQVVMVI